MKPVFGRNPSGKISFSGIICLSASIIWLISTVILSAFVFKTGYDYTYDNDELFNAHVSYLMSNGQVPYRDFLFIYPPVFHLFLIPVFKLLGFGFTAIHVLRIFMIVLYGLRLLFTFLLVRKVLGRLEAFLFIPLILLDPLTNFASMQIRPDNLMMFLFVLGLYLLFSALPKTEKVKLFLSGFLISSSVLTMFKIVPGAAAVFLIITGYLAIRKKIQALTFWISGIMLPVFILVLFFLFSGNLMLFVRSILTDAGLIMQSIIYPAHFGFHYKPGNTFLYGFPGRPANWYYAILLPVAGLVGWLIYAYRFLGKGSQNNSRFISGSILLMVSLLQAIYLVTGPTAYIQYYLPVNWLLSVFFSFILVKLWEEVRRNKYLSVILVGFVICIYSIIYNTTIQASMIRSSMNFRETEKSVEKYWRVIGEKDRVFPSYLFRQGSYPVVFGQFIGDIHKSILSRYPSIAMALSERKVKYALVSDYLIRFLDQPTRDYLKKHYSRSKDFSDLYILKD